MPKSASAPLFGHVEAVIIPAGIRPGQLKILKDSFVIRGGTICSSPSESTTTHIITALKSLPQIVTALNLERDCLHPNWKLVTPEFVSKSIVAGRLDDTSGVHILPRTSSMKAGDTPVKKDLAEVIVLDSDAETEPYDESDLQQMELGQPELDLSSSPPSVALNSAPSFLDSQHSQTDHNIAAYSDIDEEHAEGEFQRRVDAKNIIIPEPLLKYIRGDHISATTPTKLNKNIIDEFLLLVSRAEAEGNQWRIRAYKRAVKLISGLQFKITRGEDVKDVAGIGKSMREKIDEILQTGQSKKAHTVPEKFGPLDVFKKIYGVGPSIAERFYTKGYRTLEDVRTKAILTRDQQLGIKYYEDFLQRIPRSECDAISEFVCKVVKKLDPAVICRLMGSYLRGSETCGDVDFMVSHPDGQWHPDLLDSIVSELKASNFIVDSLSSSHFGEGKSLKPMQETVYRGVCKLPHGSGIARRLDILVVPFEQLGAATIYFTGNDYFNRCVRLLARKMGYSLSQHGLTTRDGKVMIASRTEKEIFDVLGIPWRPPQERNF